MSKKNLLLDSRRPQRQHHARLLELELPLLLEQREWVLADPKLRASRPHCAALGLAFLGGGMPTLGLLLECWAAGELSVPCACGGTVHLWLVSGSPFSGGHSVRGRCPRCGSAGPMRLDGRGRSAGRMVQYVRERHGSELLPAEAEAEDGAVPFEELVARLRGKANA